MSIDLGVLTPENAQSVEQARAIFMEESSACQIAGQLVENAKEVFDAYTDDEWPFAGGPEAFRNVRPLGYNLGMNCKSAFHSVDIHCPNCARPISVLRGLSADCQPISMIVHAVHLKSWRPGHHKIA